MINRAIIETKQIIDNLLNLYLLYLIPNYEYIIVFLIKLNFHSIYNASSFNRIKQQFQSFPYQIRDNLYCRIKQMGQSCCSFQHSKNKLDYPEELIDIIKELKAQNHTQNKTSSNGVNNNAKANQLKIINDGYGEITIDHMQYFGNFQRETFNGKGLLVSKTPKSLIVQKQKSRNQQNLETIKETEGNEEISLNGGLNDGYIIEYYYGTFKNGKCDGQGEQKRSNLKFIGRYDNGQRVYGKLKCDLFQYQGQFKENKFHGKGKIRYTNGSIYQGQFENGNIHGKGQFKVTDNQIYTGSFRNNMLHGYGTYQWKNHQAKYEGEYFQGKKHGFGKIQVGQFIYEGRWLMGKMNGNGRVICQHKMAFGQWESGKLCV